MHCVLCASLFVGPLGDGDYTVVLMAACWKPDVYGVVKVDVALLEEIEAEEEWFCRAAAPEIPSFLTPRKVRGGIPT